MRYVAYGLHDGICDHIHGSISEAQACCERFADLHLNITDRLPRSVASLIGDALRSDRKDVAEELIRRLQRPAG